jgi:tyrosine-protein kinase
MSQGERSRGHIGRDRRNTITGIRSEQNTLQQRLRVLWRRKWIILLGVILVPAGAIGYSFHQQALYRASADVLINTQNNLVQDIAGATAPQDPQRFLDTQAALAREPEVARNVIAVANAPGLTADEFLKASSVSEKTGANLLVFNVTDHRSAVAARLAGEYARQYVLFERKLDTSALQAAIGKVRARIADLGPNDRSSALYSSLTDKEQQLETALTLLTSTATVVRTPDSAQKTEPRPKRNGALALVLGLIIGVGLALLRETLDTRVRTAGEISSETGLTLLARIPAPPRGLRTKNRLVMIDDPFSPNAEANRSLRTNVEFTNLETNARSIMVTSALEGEGKSTTAANLALAFARAGDRVILVDLDLRRPFIHQFFDHQSQPGITDVVVGQVELADALFEVPIKGPPEDRSASSKQEGRAATGNGLMSKRLGVLPAGRLPPDPGEFVRSQALAQTLVDLRKRADIVIVDSPPLLHVSDALTLSTAVDALIVVTRLDKVRRNILTELNRVLATCPTPRLGFVLTAAEQEDGYEDEYAGYYYRTQSHDESVVSRTRSEG